MLHGFADLLFISPLAPRVRRLHIAKRVVLYVLAAGLVIFPIVWFAVLECKRFPVWIPFAFAALAVHLLAKLMFNSSKHIQHRFSKIKGKHFFMKIWLILEYVLFMWLVYLFYPLACILIPGALWLMGAESFWGLHFVYDLLMNHAEAFVMAGSILSYILFILGDGYRKIKAGFLPDYLGLYAVLTVMSGTMERAAIWLFGFVPIDSGGVLTAMSQIFTLSNDSMSIVASAMTLFFAVYSLYKTCGVEEAEAEFEGYDDMPEAEAQDEQQQDGEIQSMENSVTEPHSDIDPPPASDGDESLI